METHLHRFLVNKRNTFFLFSFFFFACNNNIILRMKNPNRASSTRGRGNKRDRQVTTGLAGTAATREAKLARRWGIYIGFSRPDSDLLGIRPSLPSLCPSHRRLLPRPSHHVELIKASLILVWWNGRAETGKRGRRRRRKTRTPRREKNKRRGEEEAMSGAEVKTGY